MTKEFETFIEDGANLEHDRWARWQKYMFSKGYIFSTQDSNPPELGSFVLRPEFVDRWFRQVDTPYSKLSESEKESDRKETRNYLPLIKQHFLPKSVIREKIEKSIGVPPPCLDILIDGKTVEQSQQYVEGAEDMREQIKKNLLKDLDL